MEWMTASLFAIHDNFGVQIQDIGTIFMIEGWQASHKNFREMGWELEQSHNLKEEIRKP